MPPSTPAARHPMRQSFPPAEPIAETPPREDLKLFALSFTAFFICFYTFLI